MNEAEETNDVQPLLDYLRRSRGFDFTDYKPSTLYRRLRKRMQVLNVNAFGEYIDYLEVHPEEFTLLFNTVLINVTSFFREPAAWDFLQQDVLPRILATKGPNDPVRAWSAGCASGEEAYTMAMILAEAMGEDAFRQRAKIYATDIDEEALFLARGASYDVATAQSVPAELREKYFEQAGSRFVFRNDLRRTVVFGRHDLLQDAPISRVDLLVCRNTLMYFNAEAQGRILARFHFALNGIGYLFLGRAEMLIFHANLFTPVDMRFRIFTKLPQAIGRDRMVLPPEARDTDVPNPWEQYGRLREEAFGAAPVAQIALDIEGRLSLATAPARTLFGLSLRDLGRPFQDLEVSYRPVELRSHIQRATTERRAITIPNVERIGQGGESQWFEVTVTPLQEGNGEPLGVSICFLNVSRIHQIQGDLLRVTQERETAYEELQSTNEELETTNEELQSTVEELQTTNEELQSTNEELETMNEELQSINEQLRAANDESRQHAKDLNRVNEFLQSIMTSVHFGMMVLDENLVVQLWNSRAQDMWGLRPDEAVGRHLQDLDIGLPVKDLVDSLRTFLAQEDRLKELVLDAVNRRGRSIRCRVTYTVSQRGGLVLLMEEMEKTDK